MSPGARAAVEAVGVTLLVSIVVAALAWPVPLAPNAFVVGSSSNDHASIAWTLGFVADRLASGQVPWGHTETIGFPDGVTLWPADLPEAVLVTPLARWAGATAAANLLAILHHGLAAGLGWGWLRREGLGAVGAATGALALGFHAALVASTWNGNPDVTPFYWVPAALWAVTGPGRGHALAAGLLIAIGGWCNPYVGVMAAVAVGVRLAVDRRFADLALAGVIGALGAIGAIAAANSALHAADAAVVKGPRADLTGVASLLALVRPSPAIVRTDPAWALPRVATGAYLGVTLLGLALLARERRAFGWILVGIGVLAALGPELVLFDPPSDAVPGVDPPPRGTGIPLPWALTAAVPGLGALHLTHRFTGLAAVGLAWLAGRAADRVGRLAPAAVAVDLLVGAGAVWLLRGAPALDDGTCEALAGLPDGAVLDLPLGHHEIGLATQQCHGRPVVSGINQPVSPRARIALDKGPGRSSTVPLGGEPARGDMSPRLAADGTVGDRSRGPATGAGAERAPGALLALGVRWIVVHELIPSDEHGDLLDEACVAARAEQVVVYDLECLRDRVAR